MINTNDDSPVRNSLPLVELLPWEREWAHHIGKERHEVNLKRRDASWYDARRMEDNLTASISASVAELAVAKHVNQYWSGSIWPIVDHKQYKDLPDVGRNIEVRTVRTSDSAAVREHQVGKGLILWVAKPVRPALESVEMWGWLPMDEAWELGTPAHYDKSGRTRVVHKSHLSQKATPAV